GVDITTATLAAWLGERAEGRRDFVLLDVMPARSFARRHIPGAVNLPVDDIDVARARAAVGDPERTVVVTCAAYDCGASTRAAERLEVLGYRHVVEHAPGLAGFGERRGLLHPAPTPRANAPGEVAL